MPSSGFDEDSDRQQAGEVGRRYIEGLFRGVSREAERETRLLVRNIEDILGGITNAFIDIAEGREITDAFADLGYSIGDTLLQSFTNRVAGELADVILNEISGVREQQGSLGNLLGIGSAGASAGGSAGAGTSLLSGLGSIASTALPIASIAALLALPAYGAYQHITNPDISGAGRGRGEQGDLPSQPFNRGARNRTSDDPAFNRGRGYQRTIDEATAEVDTLVEETVESAVEAFGGFYGIIESQLEENLNQATSNLDFAELTGRGIGDAVQSVIMAQTEFYQHQIEEINRVRRETGNLSFGNVEELIRELNALNNDARSQLDRISSIVRFTPRTERGRTPGSRYNASLGLFEQIPTAGSESLAPEGSRDPTAPLDATGTSETPATVAEDALASVIEAINEDVQLINASITSIETQIDQSNDPVEIAELLSQVPALITEKYQQLRDALETRFAEGEITEDVFNASLSELESSKSEELERHSDTVLANTLRAINDDVQLIDASITSIQTQIDQLGEPEAIAELLDEVPALIAEKYQRLRDALSERYYAGEITANVYSASISELASRESADLESQSDAVLANTLRAINDDVELINASISGIETQIDQSNDPETIAGLLNQIPSLITEKYRKLREALDAKYAASEISTDVYSASLTALATSESAEIEQHSDDVLANTLSEIDDDVALIDAEIGALQLAVNQSDDPEAVAGLLDAIKILVANKYQNLRERLSELHTAEEISDTAFNASITALSTAESKALADIDTQALNAISTDAQDRVDFLNGAIENLRLSLQLTDDPAEIQSILDAIKTLTRGRFAILRQELEKIRHTLSDGEYAQALEGLNLGEQLALSNLDTEKFAAISAEADEQVAFINGSIENLRLAIELTDDPAEQQQILDSIKFLVMARFDVLRDELQKIRERLSPEEYEQALTGLNLSEQLSIENLDTEKFAAISASAQRQVGLINGAIENLRLAFQLSDDPAETQQLLDAIKILTGNRFDVLIQELKDIEENLDPDEFQQALTGLALGKQVALEAIDTEKFSVISAAAQRQVNFVNGAIGNLETALQLTDDPAEIQQIIESIKILTRGRFAILRQELEDIRENLKPEEFSQALKGLNLGEQLAIQNLDTRKFDAISTEAQKQVDFINGSIENLRLSLQLTDDPAEAQQILDAIKILVAARFRVLIDNLHAVRASLSDAEFGQALTGLRLGEQVALRGIDNEKIAITLSGIDTQIAGIDAEIQQAFDELDVQTTASGVSESIARLRTAIESKYDALRQKISESALGEEEKARQIADIDSKEDEAFTGLGESGLGQFRSLIDTAQFLLDNATEGEFASRRQGLIDAIKTFYDERTAFIEGQDISDTDRANLLQVANIQRDIALRAVPEMHESVRERLALEQDLADAIKDINQDVADERERINEGLNDRLEDLARDSVDVEQKKLRAIEDLNTDHQARIEEIRLGSARRIEDIERDVQRRIADINREAERDIADLEDDPTKGVRTQARERREAIAEIRERQSEAIEDASLRGVRGREDVGIRERRDVLDAETQRTERAAEISRRAVQEESEILQREQQIRLEAAAAHREALESASDARQQARHEFSTTHQETIETLADTRQSEREDTADTRQTSREDMTDTRQVDRDTVADTRQETRDLSHRAAVVGIQDFIDTRLLNRLTAEHSAAIAIQDLIDARHDTRIQESIAVATRIEGAVRAAQALPSPRLYDRYDSLDEPRSRQRGGSSEPIRVEVINNERPIEINQRIETVQDFGDATIKKISNSQTRLRQMGRIVE